MIIARVIFPAESRLIRELVFLDKVDATQLCRIHIQLNREDFDHPLDEIDRFGHTERTTVGHATRCFVRVDTINREVSGRDVIGPRADVHKACRELGRVRTSVERAVVSGHVAMQARDLAVLGCSDFTRHPVIASKRGGHEVFHTVLDPLHGLTRYDGCNDRTDVARINAHFVTKAATNVGGNHTDVVLFDTRQKGRHGPHDVRCLERAPNGELAVHLVHRRDRAAGFQRARVRAVVIHGFGRDDFGVVDHVVGCSLFASFPRKDVVVMLTRTMRAFLLVGDVLAQNNIGLQRLERVHNHGQFFVIDLDQFDRVSRDKAVFGDDESNLLALEQNFTVGQNHLFVARKGRHPVKVKRREISRRQNSNHTVYRHRLGRIDGFDPRVSIGRTDEIAVQHAGQFHVIDVVAFALGETSVLNPLARATHPLEICGTLYLIFVQVFHSAASFAAFSSLAAARMDFTMFW